MLRAKEKNRGFTSTPARPASRSEAGENHGRKSVVWGFTLLDVIFAMGIIIVGLIAVLGLLRYVILAGRYSNDKFIATNLAQEGMEIVRAVRDSNWLAHQTWNQGLGSGDYQAQYNSVSLASYSSSSQPLKIDAGGYYNYDTGQNSKFSRKIIIRQPPDTICPADAVVPNDDNFCAIVEVSWQMLGLNYTTLIQDRFYNWYRP